ncbi:MAG: OsmC family protein [Rubrobacteraceae bacterium]
MKDIGETGGAKNGRRTPETASVTLLEGMRFAGETGGQQVDLDPQAEYGGGAGAQPMRLVLAALAGCTAMDVFAVLRKKRQGVSGLAVEACDYAAKGRPKVYERGEVLYRVLGRGLDEKAVGRAIELSSDRLRPVMAMVKGVPEIEMRHEVERGAPEPVGIRGGEVGG